MIQSIALTHSLRLTVVCAGHQLHHPRVRDATGPIDVAHDPNRSTFLNLERIHRALGLPATAAAAAGIAITEWDPVPSAAVGKACHLPIDHVLSYGTSKVVAFGSFCRARWIEWCERRRKTAEIRHLQDVWVDGIRQLRFERAVVDQPPAVGVHPATGVHRWLPMTVFLAPPPCRWKLARVVAKAIALAHGVPYVSVEPKRHMTMEMKKIERRTDGQPFRVRHRAARNNDGALLMACV